MKFSAWPETTLKYSLSKKHNFSSWDLLRAQADTLGDVVKIFHSNVLNGRM